MPKKVRIRDRPRQGPTPETVGFDVYRGNGFIGENYHYYVTPVGTSNIIFEQIDSIFGTIRGPKPIDIKKDMQEAISQAYELTIATADRLANSGRRKYIIVNETSRAQQSSLETKTEEPIVRPGHAAP